MSIFVTALAKSKPGRSENLKPLLLALVKASRDEAACVQYDLHQSSVDDNLFIFHEEWADQAGFEQHTRQEHLLAFGEAATSLMEGPMTIHFTNKLA